MSNLEGILQEGLKVLIEDDSETVWEARTMYKEEKNR